MRIPPAHTAHAAQAMSGAGFIPHTMAHAMPHSRRARTMGSFLIVSKRK